jgi:hypothetical protein
MQILFYGSDLRLTLSRFNNVDEVVRLAIVSGKTEVHNGHAHWFGVSDFTLVQNNLIL